MARVRGGNTGFAVALVIFGCGFVIALLVAIIFYTKIEEAKVAELQAKEDLAVYISGGDTTLANDFKSDTGTVFNNMLNQIRSLESEILRKDRDIASLTSANNEKEAQFTALTLDKESVDEQLSAERRTAEQMLAELEAGVERAMREKSALQDEITQMQGVLTRTAEDADAAARERIAQLTEQVQALESEMFALQSDRDSWKREYDLLFASLPTPPEVNTTTPDAEVASIFGGGNDLFITVGRNDGLVMGMTFEVFNPEPVIRLATTGEARGKATIEVYSLDADSATCRVVRLDRGASINPGDPVVNLGFDPNMTIVMFAFGEFDIEKDGGTNDIGRIEALVKESGAKLANVTRNQAGIPILTPDITYVVLGEKPELPDQPSPDEFDPVKIAEYQAQLAANEAYFQIVDDAKILRIPVLSQDRFLDLIGYYVR